MAKMPMMDRDPTAPPLNPLPPVVWLLALPVVAVEIVLSLGANSVIGGADAIGWRVAAMERFAFLNAVFDWMVQNHRYPADQMMRFVTYPFIHGSATHAIFVAVFILALGKMVGELFRPWAVLAVFFGSAIMGALVYGAALNDPVPLVGGYPAVYGLIGAFTFIQWVAARITGSNQMQAFRLIGFLLATQLLFSVLFGSNTQWLADVVGFVTGFALSFVVSPGGWGRALARIRGQ